jgi:hypothetical protein
MRNFIRNGFALALLLGIVSWGAPAAADVFVRADYDKTKQVFVHIDIDKSKNVFVDVDFLAVLEGSAEAEAVVNQRNEVNFVDDAVDGELDDFQLELDALIENSVSTNTGIVGVNQDVGNMVNQANVVSFAITNSETAFVDSEAFAEQVNVENFARQEEFLDCENGSCDADRTAEIQNSVNNNTGIVGVNQNAGNNNNQANAIAMAVGLGSHLALSEAALGQENAFNISIGIETVKTDLIENSILGNSGVVGVNQSVGNNNNQGSVISMSALTTNVSLEVPGSN